MVLRRSAYLVAMALLCARCANDPSVGPPQDGAPPPPDAPLQIDSVSIDAKLLVISADGSEGMLGAIRQALDFQGTPYVVWIASQNPGALTAAALSEGKHGFFQGVILTSGTLGGPPSLLSDAEWQALRDYQVAFGVRQATFYTRPTPDYGFGAATGQDTSQTPITATLTPAGRAVFPYLTGQLTINDVSAYLAAPADDQTTSLLTDGAGHALIAVKTYDDGRENLALTFNGNEFLTHTVAVSYGVINWVTRGLFIGERHVFAGPQVDDVFLGNALFAGGVYRITGDDLHAVAAWQRAVRQRPTTQGLILTLAFNGKGTMGMYSPDTLTPAAQELKGEFRWVSHSWSHYNLDVADYAIAADEIAQNDDLAVQMQLGAYSRVNIVTPGHSGLANPLAMQAAHDQGIAFLISNTSRVGQDNPFPNVGIINALQPALLEIPRHPTEIFFDVTTPDEEVTEYRTRHTGDLSYEQIIEKESDHLVHYMLKGDIDPWMFHQSNLRAYDGTRTLLGDLLDRTLQKYDAVYNLPVLTPVMDDLGARFAARTELHGSGAAGTIVPGKSITLTVDRDATVPVTGLLVAGAEQYGGQPIALVRVTAGSSVTILLP